ncbi:Bypass of stop codon protein 6 [Leucoagaricus sp. SymC.cos]|nr:Bypass of stop codon protein 6 [Leucoagaricus sp. SymC.cos]
MTTLLTTAVDESCQMNGVLRGRRRSSVHPLSAVPRLYFAPHSTAEPLSDGSALADDIELVPKASDPLPGDLPAPLETSVAHISPLSIAHVSDYAPKMVVPRHQDSTGSSMLNLEMTSLPTTPSGFTPTASSSRKGSADNLMSYFPPPEGGDGTVGGGREKETFERKKWRLAAGFFAFFMCGWGDGITGTVLPFFMADFHVSFTMSSLLFTGTTFGFFSCTLLIEVIMKTLSRTPMDGERSAWFPSLAPTRSKKPHGPVIRSSFLQGQHLSLVLASLIHASFFVMMGSTRGYVTIFTAYVVAAFARAILTASLNQYFNTVMPQSLGYGYGLWSFGGVVSPLICQTLVGVGIPWKHFYFGSLVLSAFNTGLLLLTFRPTTKEWIKESSQAKRENGERNSDQITISNSDGKLDVGPAQEVAANNTKARAAPRSALRWAFSLGLEWAFLFFIFVYYGCETTTQGFIVSYLLGARHANPKTVGYVSSGFWAGISLGRFTWGYFMPRLSFTQRKWLVQASLAVGLIMEFLIWFVNSNAASAFFTSVIGLVFGPVYPAVLSLATAALPDELQMISMALIGAAGSLGSAIFPFIAGIVSTSKGVETVTYVTVGLAGAVFTMWFFFPSRLSAIKH